MLIKRLQTFLGPRQPPPPSTADITAVSNVKPEEISWLIQDWIPKGKVSVLFGDPGLGKSLVSLDIAARLTTGRNFLSPSPTLPLPHSNVLLFSIEDNASDTIRPRLEAAGADLSRVHLFPDGGRRQFSDYRSLISLIRELSASLVIVDPLSAYLGSRYISSDQQIRELFASMASFAQHTGATFLIVHHPNKARSGAAVMRSAGSLAVAAAARSVMLIARDPEDPSSRILAVVKGNLGPPPPARRFHFDQEQDARQPNIIWDGVAKTVTADTLLHKASREDRAQMSAERFLRETLANGPVPSKELEEHALAQGYSRGVFARAKMAITHSTRTGGIGAAGAWLTSLNSTAKSRSDIDD
jgi:archaellum biogenesis ATPase FlaH